MAVETTAARLWESLHDKHGFYGLLFDGKKLALRVTAEADVDALEAQVQFITQDTQENVRRPISGQQWWRIDTGVGAEPPPLRVRRTDSQRVPLPGPACGGPT